METGAGENFMKALNTTILGIAMAFGALALYAQAPSTDAAAQQQSGQWRKVGSAPAAQPADTVGNQTLSAPDGDQAGPPPPEDEQDQAPPPPENHGWQSSGGPAPQQQGGWTRFGGTQQQLDVRPALVQSQYRLEFFERLGKGVQASVGLAHQEVPLR